MICKNCIHFKVCKDYSIYKDTIYACEDFKDGTIKNQYDRIRNMSIEEMAELFTALLHEEDMKIAKKLGESGYNVSVVEFDFDLQAMIHKKWLESEVTE